jgi:hypothetical protein
MKVTANLTGLGADDEQLDGTVLSGPNITILELIITQNKNKQAFYSLKC